MKRVLQIFCRFTALSAIFFLSCTKEDFTNCRGEVRVYFGLSSQDINPILVDRMHLYVFNQSGIFVGEYRDNLILNFNADYYIDCSDLLPGSYRFVAWGGKDELFYTTSPLQFVKGKTTFDEVLIMLEHPQNTLSTPLHHIFHSELSTEVLFIRDLQRINMTLYQLSNTINVSTVGLPANSDSFTFGITDVNCTYKFDRSFASHSHEPFSYTTLCSKNNANQLNGSLQVLRLSANRHTPQLQIYNNSADSLLYPVGSQSGDLIGLILKATPNNNFDTTHTYDIVLTFSGDGSTGFDVSITINGWKVRDEDNELID